MEKKNGNWTIKETKEVFGNDFFKVLDDKVIKPNGENGNYATIEFVPGVSVLPIDDEDFVYLTKQFRYSAGQETLEVVAGGIEDENPLDAAKREVKEELGISAEEFEEMGTIQIDNSIIKGQSTLFLARKLTFGKTDRDESEEMETVRISFKEAVEKVLNGEITHAPSCILLLRAWVENQKQL
jgi:8-oxo-dGTP pyrophosphatase MutT (NUDIX family)